MLVVLAFMLVGGVLALAGLTALGAHRRGMAMLPALGVGLIFPATWIAWYLRDEHPYRRARQHAG